MKRKLKGVWQAVGNAFTRGCQRLRQLVQPAWLRQLPQRLRRIPAAFGKLPGLFRPLLHRLSSLPAKLRRIPAALACIPAALRVIPSTLKKGWRHVARWPDLLRAKLQAALRWRPGARFWSVVLGLATVPLGALLMLTPVRELATGRAADLRTLLTVSWLLTGFLTLTAGLGLLFRTPAFRRVLALALVCSLPLPGAFGYQTFTLAMKMRAATEAATKETLQPWVNGGVQLTLLFLGVTAFLGTLLWLKPLRTLPRAKPLMQTWAGVVLAPAYGATYGAGAGLALWTGLRFLADYQAVQWLRDGLGIVSIDYLAYGLGAFGAFWTVIRRKRARGPKAKAVARPQVNAPRAAPTAAAATAAPAKHPAAAAQPSSATKPNLGPTHAPASKPLPINLPARPTTVTTTKTP